MRPFLSIVIANYNYGHLLEDAFRSVFRQPCNDFELIVIDGGSTDNSVDIIKKYESGIAYWVSEKDAGQGEAFRKGFDKAQGHYLTWLNADDIFIAGFFDRFKRAVEQSPGEEWFVSGCIHTEPDLRVVRCTQARRFSNYEALHGHIPVYAPSSFFSRDLYWRVGGIDDTYYSVMDVDLWSKFFYKAHVRYRTIPGYAFAFRMHPLSKTTANHFEGSPYRDPDSPLQEKYKKDYARLNAWIPTVGPMGRFSRLIRSQWSKHIYSAIDTFRFKGRKLSDLGLADLGSCTNGIA